MTVAHHARDTSDHPSDLLDSEANLRHILLTVREDLGADVVTLLQLDPASRHLVTVLTDSAVRTTAVHHRVPVGRGLAGRVAQFATPISLDEVSQDDLVNPAFLALGVRSVLGVPVRNGHRVTGVLKVGFRERRRFLPDEVALTEAMAVQVSEAMEEYVAADERAAAAALQRSLVPSTLPAIEGLDLAGRYLPGQGGVSGDWYDVFELPGGRVGMVMGDVAGHGLPASVVMGRLRSALRAYSLEYDAPEEVLAHLDAKIMHFEPGAMATAVYAIAEPPFDHVRLSSAGHFLPLHLSPDGVARQVDLPVSLPLGVDPGVRADQRSGAARARLRSRAVHRRPARETHRQLPAQRRGVRIDRRRSRRAVPDPALRGRRRDVVAHSRHDADPRTAERRRRAARHPPRGWRAR